MSADAPHRPLPHAGTRLAGIDGLRALAMTMVIAQHCGLLPFGWVGVWLFFVISGYVITRGFLAEASTGAALPSKARRYGAFVRRRLVRIVPAYALYLVLCVLLFAGIYGVAGAADLVGLVTFTYNWQMVFQPASAAVHWPAIGHLWTLSVEQQFYVFYPLLVLGVPARWRWRVAGALVVLAPVTRALWVAAFAAAVPAADAGRMAFGVYASTVCQVDAFLLGALLARFEPRLLRDPRLAGRLLGVALAVLVLYGAGCMALNHARGDRGLALAKNILSGTLYGQGRELFGYSVVNLVAAAVLLATLTGLRGTDWLSWRWLGWTGRVSYGGYLFHALLLWGLSTLIGEPLKNAALPWRLAGFVGVWCATVGLASLSFIGFEQRVARRFKAWSNGDSPALHVPRSTQRTAP